MLAMAAWKANKAVQFVLAMHPNIDSHLGQLGSRLFATEDGCLQHRQLQAGSNIAANISDYVKCKTFQHDPRLQEAISSQ